MEDKIKVMLSTEGTYPFHQGGVSTWADMLIKSLSSNLEFTLFSIIMNPFVTQKFNLPPGTKIIKVPLWGTEEPSEHLNIPFSEVYMMKKKTVDKVIRQRFVPLFLDLMEELVAKEKNPEKLGKTMYGLYQYFKEYEYKKSFKSEHTWEAYKKFILQYTNNTDNKMEHPGVYSIVQSLGWVYRFMNILNTPVPKVHVTHSAAAAFCGIPCIISKIENNTPYILTEHGVYLREQYLSLSQRGYSSFLNTFLIRMIHSIVDMNYFYADQVSPVCSYNTRWEKKFGVDKKRIEVIYNGVDKNSLVPKLPVQKNKYPTVVAVARIDPIKDIKGLMRAADIVRKEVSDVRFVIYGSVTVPEYYEECLKLKDELKLGEHFILAGHTSDVASSYQSGDVIALSSISEAFPYSVVEAMMVGRAVVSTDVGGIKEALGDTGILVAPNSPVEMAEGIIKLLKDPKLRNDLASEAKERALSLFTVRRFQELYLKSYIRLSLGQPMPTMEPGESKVVIIPEKNISKETAVAIIDKDRSKYKLLMEKGYGLLHYGFYYQAIYYFRLAAKEVKEPQMVSFILVEIANIYNSIGEFDKATYELQKAEALKNFR